MTTEKNSNIKEWISKEAGDPSKPGILEQWADRSPINNADRLDGNLLLIHGTNDKRVPFSESSTFHRKLLDLGKQQNVELVPLEGGGHVPTTKSDLLIRYSAWFRFLDRQH